VSFVLNNTRGQTLRPETRRRVREAADRLGYVPHRIAQALREGSSRVVLLRLGALRGGDILDGLIAAMGDELHDLGYVLVVSHDEDDSAGPGGTGLIDAVAPRSVIDLARRYVVATPVSADDDPDDGGWVDGLAAHGALQIKYLASQGHRIIAMLLPGDGSYTRLAQLRLDHARHTAHRLGLEPVRAVTLPRSLPAAIDAIQRLYAQSNRVTAAASFSDELAIVALSAMARLGLRAPEDLAVIGFDGSPFGELWDPALTTLSIDAAQYGRRWARASLGLPLEPWQQPPSRVIVRASA
jgi:DNA-binding LacI/PurR family transcriptional regulator